MTGCVGKATEQSTLCLIMACPLPVSDLNVSDLVAVACPALQTKYIKQMSLLYQTAAWSTSKTSICILSLNSACSLQHV